MTHTPTIRILFMGTPEFAVPSLRRLHERSVEQGWQVVAVATQPDRPAGRGKQLVASPVKQYAAQHDILTLQPASLRKDPDAVEAIRNLAPDLIAVAAYGLLLPRSVLEIPTFGCLNVHASLLPAYRGASPIMAVLLDGQAQTGITIMLMDAGLDTGPVLRQARQPIFAGDTTETLSQRLAEQGADLLVETLPTWLAGDLAPIPQSDLPGTPNVVKQIKKEAGLIDWRQPAAHIERMTRAYTPWPAAYTRWRSEPFKVLAAEVTTGNTEPGHVVRTQAGIAVGTGDGLLLLRLVQPAGKKPMDIQSFINGAPTFVGALLPDSNAAP
ncbi:MAG: methionyl-tRNA formyltransferase [Anaerolineales bacterium]|nr:methionyl-tRNA formyltransferase [Anaerolineales bacterium]